MAAPPVLPLDLAGHESELTVSIADASVGTVRLGNIMRVSRAACHARRLPRADTAWRHFVKEHPADKDVLLPGNRLPLTQAGGLRLGFVAHCQQAEHSLPTNENTQLSYVKKKKVPAKRRRAPLRVQVSCTMSVGGMQGS